MPTIAEELRNFNIDGDPSSGKYEIDRVRLREALIAEAVAGIPVVRLRSGSAPVNIFDMVDVWNSAGTQFNAIKMDVTDTGSGELSRFVHILKNGATRFEVRPDGNFGQMILYNSTGANFGGITLTSGGTMALTHLLSAATGQPAHVMRYYWETTEAGGVAVLRGMGTNRFSIESGAAIVHIAGNGRYEWEGLGTERLSWNSYQAASSLHRPIDVNFEGVVNDGSNRFPLMSFSGRADFTNDLMWWGRKTVGGSWQTAYSRVDALGKFFMPALELTGVANATGLTMVGGTLSGSNAQASISVAAAWNTSGAPTAILANITDTASAAGSLLVDLQTGGTSRASVRKDGLLTAASGTFTGAGGSGSSRVLAAEVAGYAPFEVTYDGMTRLRGVNSAGQITMRMDNAIVSVMRELQMFSTIASLMDGTSTIGFRADPNIGRLILKSSDHITFMPLSNTIERMRLTAGGLLTFGGVTTSFPALKPNGAELQVRLANDSASGVIDARLRLQTAAAPSSAADLGGAGEVRWDPSFLYVCTATNTWRRVALATW